tara:strand:- start:266 stop:664 length:399 start_codon:yes stop_codon:yes gene_type:complete
MRKIIKFLIAGGTGFIVDMVVLFLVLHYTPFGPYVGRALAIAAAMTCTWMINRRFTFDASGRTLRSEGARYGSVGLASAFINYSVFSVLIALMPSISPFLALIISSASATVFSYLGYSHFVFGKPKTETEIH